MNHRLGRVSVIGARGFIGNAFVSHLRKLGIAPLGLRHDEIAAGAELGTVIYCSGVAWGAESRVLNAYDAHVSGVARIIEQCSWERIVYLSSTRVYDGAANTEEDMQVPVEPAHIADVYRLSKLAGESIVLNAHPANLVVRLSNVYGESFHSGLFLSDILRQGAQTGRIVVRSSLESSKDYVSVDDVVYAATALLDAGAAGIFNVGAGYNTKHRAIFDAILRVSGITVDVPIDAPTSVVRGISIKKLRGALPFSPSSVVDDIPGLWCAFLANC